MEQMVNCCENKVCITDMAQKGSVGPKSLFEGFLVYYTTELRLDIKDIGEPLKVLSKEIKWRVEFQIHHSRTGHTWALRGTNVKQGDQSESFPDVTQAINDNKFK